MALSKKPASDLRATIQAVLGHAPEHIEPGRLHRFPTSEKRGDNAGWCKLFHDLRGGVFGCHRQGVSEKWSVTDRATMTPSQRADRARQVMAARAEREAQQRQHWAENAQRIDKLWSETVPLVPGDPVTLYLKARGFAGVWPLPDALRYHRAMPYWEAGAKLGNFPALVAPLVLDGRTVALHRTYLTRDGQKADVPTVRKLTCAAGPLAGACITLHKPASGCIAIAEGIETALAGWCASRLPTVAAYSAGNLAAYRWPPGVQRLVVFADHDKAGQDAAEALRVRAVAARLRCEVLTPTDPGADWCNVWASRGAVEVST